MENEMDDENEMTICDFCAKEVLIEDHDDCRPDDLGFCVLCGAQIGDDNVGE